MLLILLTAVVWPVTPARAQQPLPYQGFRSPTNNIHCMLEDFDTSPLRLRCDIMKVDPPRIPRPRWCHGEWDTAFALRPDDTVAERLCVTDTVYNEEWPILLYGQTWQAKGFTCQIERVGLTCYNARKSGFTISRGKRQLF